MAHLWLNGGRFPVWISDDVREMRMCELYHCLPSQLGGEETYKLRRHQAIRAAEAEYNKRDAESNARAAKRRGR